MQAHLHMEGFWWVQEARPRLPRTQEALGCEAGDSGPGAWAGELHPACGLALSTSVSTPR